MRGSGFEPQHYLPPTPCEPFFILRIILLYLDCLAPILFYILILCCFFLRRVFREGISFEIETEPNCRSSGVRNEVQGICVQLPAFQGPSRRRAILGGHTSTLPFFTTPSSLTPYSPDASLAYVLRPAHRSFALAAHSSPLATSTMALPKINYKDESPPPPPGFFDSPPVEFDWGYPPDRLPTRFNPDYNRWY